MPAIEVSNINKLAESFADFWRQSWARGVCAAMLNRVQILVELNPEKIEFVGRIVVVGDAL
jgi:hypothetical protein